MTLQTAVPSARPTGAAGAPAGLTSTALHAAGLAVRTGLVWTFRYATMRQAMSYTRQALNGTDAP